MSFTHGSLFSGIGGFDLAAEWMGWKNAFHCEWNPFGQKILKHYWPDAESFTDITKTDFTKYENKIDILTGGFPCQPYSAAGKRRGKDDDRHLWPEMLRAIREIRPTWVVGENVRGLVNWSDGLVFDEVQSDLENEGYSVFPVLLPACGVNAPHRRERIWFVAYRNSNGQHRSDSQYEKYTSEGREYAQRNIEPLGCVVADTCFERCEFAGDSRYRRTGFKDSNTSNVTNTDSIGHAGKEYRFTQSGQHPEENQGNGWQNFPTQPPICSGNDGFPARLDGITFSKWRNESIKGAGNAIVPQVAYQIFQAIDSYNFIY